MGWYCKCLLLTKADILPWRESEDCLGLSIVVNPPKRAICSDAVEANSWSRDGREKAQSSQSADRTQIHCRSAGTTRRRYFQVESLYIYSRQSWN
jgi:hypothetical protein